jgi:glutamyl-Q tRNA(Asp) synthetase
MARRRFRFAPSPNGRLHLGHAYSALFTQREARRHDGLFTLRIEDIDTFRCKQEFVDGIFEDLAWLGLKWPEPVRRQSKHLHEYIAFIDRLERLRLLYPCFCTRAKLNAIDGPKDPDGAPVYPGFCRLMTKWERQRRMVAGEPYALRLDMAKAIVAGGENLAFREEGVGPAGETGLVPCNPKAWGDVVLARKDIGTSYHIAVVHDDALEGITHVTRGQDLFHATSIHRVLQSILELPQPVYIHHPLIPDETGRKLSKSAGDRSLASLREAGVSADEIRRELGFDAA